MFYYPRPTPQDVLLEEHEHIITNSYNGKEIYEWNIDGYTDRQIYTTVHRMLMYSTICKTNKNSDKTIADMITAGFTGQLKATRSVDFPDHNTLSSSNEKSTIIVNHPNKISSDQQYMVDFHDVPSGPNPIHDCGDDIC
ncbi:hypothetical protein H5410_029103 [Solanum commersonii]|uniref:DUF7746 domain-containing protein n=1 Tax=Solanum commersonii TaxID=4109 RepID=A0A9J5Z3R2_SOLCO|nr:hypothetical protein H5410_029103 [Solanum commersonii]